MFVTRNYRLPNFCFPHGIIYGFLISVCTGFIILTIVFASLWSNCSDVSKRVAYTNVSSLNHTTNRTMFFAVENGIIGSPPILPNDGEYIQWTFLHMNDVYELLPLDQGRRGGLARVAYLRKLLIEENVNTITILAGDLLSPSALGTAQMNGSRLNGRQMVATMNSLGLDYMTFGNHEFDLAEKDLLSRMGESNFIWISSNVFAHNSTQPFGKSIPFKLIDFRGVRILLIALTIEVNGSYVTVVSQSSLVDYTKQFLQRFSNGSYDVLVALTHLDATIDIQLAENIPQIDLILGGHDHDNAYYVRGGRYTTITKADSNAITVYIHRCAFNLQTKRLRIFSTLAKVSSDVPEESQTAEVSNYWYRLGIRGFEQLGYQPAQTVSCLPPGIELDGRYESVTSSNTLLTEAVCQSLIQETRMYNTTIGLINGGTIRIDDVLPSTITQYDIIRILPFPNKITALAVPGTILSRALTTGISLKGTGLFIGYVGVQKSEQNAAWFVQGENIATSNLDYIVATTTYLRENTLLNDSRVKVFKESDETQTQALINYLKMKYPPCK